MVTINSLESLTDVTMFEVIKQYNILDFVYNSCKQCICDLQENIEYLDFVNSANLEQDASGREYLDIITNVIRVDLFLDSGIDSNFLIYYATPQGDILTYNLNACTIAIALDQINIKLDY